jgi:hypothetical protein
LGKVAVKIKVKVKVKVKEGNPLTTKEHKGNSKG